MQINLVGVTFLWLVHLQEQITAIIRLNPNMRELFMTVKQHKICL